MLQSQASGKFHCQSLSRQQSRSRSKTQYCAEDLRTEVYLVTELHHGSRDPQPERSSESLNNKFVHGVNRPEFRIHSATPGPFAPSACFKSGRQGAMETVSSSAAPSLPAHMGFEALKLDAQIHELA
jgi:hypothetical protein